MRQYLVDRIPQKKETYEGGYRIGREQVPTQESFEVCLSLAFGISSLSHDVNMMEMECVGVL